MLSRSLSLLTLAIIVAAGTGAGAAVPEDKASLLGVWVAQSVEDDGKPDSAEDVRLMRMAFVFKGDELLFRVKIDHEFEVQYDYRIDAAKSPKHLDIMRPNQEGAILGIYAIKADELRVCLRYDRSKGGRPAEFSTSADSGLILVTFKRGAKR